MPVTHIQEHTIELFVLKPDALDEATRQSVDAHIRSCLSCRETAKYLQSFYSDLQQTPRTASEHLEAFAQKVSRPYNIISLYPYRHRPSADLADDRYVTVLAADTPQTSSHRFQPVAVLTSNEHRVVVRVLRDAEASLYRLYVLADDPAKCKNVVVSFPELYADFTTDESGKAEFRLAEDKIPRDWGAVRAFLKLPD